MSILLSRLFLYATRRSPSCHTWGGKERKNKASSGLNGYGCICAIHLKAVLGAVVFKSARNYSFVRGRLQLPGFLGYALNVWCV